MEHTADEMKAGGRPSVYSPELAELICDKIGNTAMGLRSICRDLGLCYSTVYKWTMPGSSTYRASFRRMYLDAKEMQGAAMEEEIQEIADDMSQDHMLQRGGKMVANTAHIARCRMRIAARQWQLARLATRNKEVPDSAARERQWFVMGGYFIDLFDAGSMDSWKAAMAYKQQQAEQAAREAEAAAVAAAAAAGEPAAEAATEAAAPAAPAAGGYAAMFGTVDMSRVVTLEAEALAWDEDEAVVEERLAALREKGYHPGGYPPAP